MRGVRQAIWQHALTVKSVRAVDIAESFRMDKTLASAHLREMAKLGCFTRTWRVKGPARWYQYKAVQDCPPPGSGNYLHLSKTATLRLKTLRGFRYTKIEHMPVVRLAA
mgnify:CR=1 FL=1